MQDTKNLSVAEIIDIASQDLIFYGQYYFPRTVRQEVPDFHLEVSDVLDSNVYEKIAAKIFRGGAKTSLARILISKRIAFGLSRTMLIVSATAEHSYETVKWVKRAIERKDKWSRDFGLAAGNDYVNPETNERYTWRDDKIQIVCKNITDVTGLPIIISIVGTGIFGQSRGLNIEDYRPDFILLDDVVDEDNAKTEEQRKKVNDRIYGAIVNTLTPRSENPTATILMLQTPLNRFDAIELAKKDEEWRYLEYSCFDSSGKSRWEARLPTSELLRKKQGFINRNQLSLWMREMEVTITSDEMSIFSDRWALDYLWKDRDDLPEGMVIYMGVDPTPPPAPGQQLSSNELSSLDDTCLVMIGLHKGHCYVLDIEYVKHPLPLLFMNMFFAMYLKWRPRKVGFESILFARTYAHLLNNEMRARNIFVNIMYVEDRRSKSNRIRDEITDLAFMGRLHMHHKQTQLQATFIQYPDVEHDDDLDALSIALMCRNPGDIIEGEYEVLGEDSSEEESLGDWRIKLRG